MVNSDAIQKGGKAQLQKSGQTFAGRGNQVTKGAEGKAIQVSRRQTEACTGDAERHAGLITCEVWLMIELIDRWGAIPPPIYISVDYRT